MSFRELTRQAMSDGLAAVSDDAVYRSQKFAPITLTAGSVNGGVLIQRGVQIADGEGVFILEDVAVMKSGVVSHNTDDLIIVAGERWRVKSVLSDDGHKVNLSVRPAA